MIIKVKCKGRKSFRGLGLPRTVTLLAEQGDYSFLFVPDTEITNATQFTPVTEAELGFIHKNSLRVKLINERVVKLIRKEYSVDDELKCLRLGRESPEFIAYDQYVQECVGVGRLLKSELGL